jgi:hypothetical protein
MSISNARFLVPQIPERLLLNAIAVFSVAVGLLNTALAWAVYGTGGKADVWMLSFVVVQAFVLVSQIGVEQYAIFSAEHHAVSEQAGERFDRESLCWGLLFGLGFAALLSLLLPCVVTMFATGFNVQAQAEVQRTVMPLLLQVALAPMLYVLRQQLLMRGRAKVSVLLNSTFSIVQLVVLAGGWLSGQLSPSVLALFVGLGSVVAAGSALLSAGPVRKQMAAPDWRRLWPFIRASAALRFTHSIHNFLVVLLTNSALSGGVAGTVALFQYVKKVADGLSSVTVGPHLQVYHAAQAGAWARTDKYKFHENIRDYLRHALPVAAVAIAGILICWHFAGALVPSLAQKATAGAFWIFVVLSAWQVLISIESVPAGVLVVGKHTRWLLLVNALYVLNFYLIMHVVVAAPYTAMTVASLSLLCQCISTAILSFLAWTFYRKKFAGVNNA